MLGNREVKNIIQGRLSIVKCGYRRNKSNLFAMKSKVRILVRSSDQAAVICSYSRTSVAREE